jgi:hypothetical protein
MYLVCFQLIDGDKKQNKDHSPRQTSDNNGANLKLADGVHCRFTLPGEDVERIAIEDPIAIANCRGTPMKEQRTVSSEEERWRECQENQSEREDRDLRRHGLLGGEKEQVAQDAEEDSEEQRSDRHSIRPVTPR